MADEALSTCMGGEAFAFQRCGIIQKHEGFRDML